jgi:hypothetical protein
VKLPGPEFGIRRVESRARRGGRWIPPETVRRRFRRGWENLHSGYLDTFDSWAIYDGSLAPAVLIETGCNRSPDALMEEPEPATPRPAAAGRAPVRPLDDPDFIGAEAALGRAAAKAHRARPCRRA